MMGRIEQAWQTLGRAGRQAAAWLAGWARARNLLLLALALLLGDWLVTGIRVIREDEQGVVLRFGRVARVAPAGILFTLPWPIERTIAVRTTEVRTMPVGYRLIDSLRGIPPHPKEVEWITGDTNIINLTLTLKYSVADPVDYLFRIGPIEADFVVRRCAETVLTKLMATLPVDEVLTSSKAFVQEQTRLEVQEMLHDLGSGLRVVTVNIGGVEPPPTVIEAFNDVSTAKSDMAKMVNQADGYHKDIIPRARATANRLQQEAESYRATTVELSRGEAAQFTALLAQARQAAGITRQRLYLEAVERILARARLIVVDDRQTNTLRLLD